MSSPHVAADMLQPLGLLTTGLFPQFDDPDDVDTFFETLLADGYTKADDAGVDDTQQSKRDAIAIAHAYYLAYMSIWQRMSATPASASIDGEASRTFLETQIQAFEKLKDSWWSTYQSLLPVTSTVVTRTRNASGCVPIIYGW